MSHSERDQDKVVESEACCNHEPATDTTGKTSDERKKLQKAIKKAYKEEKLLNEAIRRLEAGGKVKAKHIDRRHRCASSTSTTGASSSSGTSSGSSSTSSDSDVVDLTEPVGKPSKRHHGRKHPHHGRRNRRGRERSRSRSHSRGCSRGRSRGHSPGHPRGHSPGRPRGHSRGHPRRHSPGHPRDHSPGHPRGHSPGHPRGHSRGHPRRHSRGHSRGHPRRHSRNHSRGHSRDHSRDRSRGHSRGHSKSCDQQLCQFRRFFRGASLPAAPPIQQCHHHHWRSHARPEAKHVPHIDIRRRSRSGSRSHSRDRHGKHGHKKHAKYNKQKKGEKHHQAGKENGGGASPHGREHGHQKRERSHCRDRSHSHSHSRDHRHCPYSKGEPGFVCGGCLSGRPSRGFPYFGAFSDIPTSLHAQHNSEGRYSWDRHRFDYPQGPADASNWHWMTPIYCGEGRGSRRRAHSVPGR